MSNKEFFYTDFNSLGNVMNTVLNTPVLKNSMKKATLFKFWPKAAGKKFEKYSRIDSLTPQNVLVVACANAAVSSELLMFKSDLLKKLNEYAIPLGLEIEDINFSHKIWNKQSTQQIESEEPQNPHKPDLSGFNPDMVELDEQEIESIRASIDNNKFASEQQRKKMFDAIILDLKTQKYIKENGLAH